MSKTRRDILEALADGMNQPSPTHAVYAWNKLQNELRELTGPPFHRIVKFRDLVQAIQNASKIEMQPNTFV